ncbi:MAG: PEP-CTERM sorting domain-containing protein [Burkholderiales bacterium]
MKTLWIVSLSLMPAVAMAGVNVPGRVPEPGMWALLGGVAAALAVSRFLTRKSKRKGDRQ